VEESELTMESNWDESWEWRGVVVLAIGDFFNVNVLVEVVLMLLWRHSRGHDVGLVDVHKIHAERFFIWLEGFRRVHTFLKFDETQGTGGTLSERHVTLGMLLWAVRCDIINEGDLCKNLGFGYLLLQGVRLCHEPGLVDIEIKAFISYAACGMCGCLFSVYVML
jgi:hypothetical protein